MSEHAPGWTVLFGSIRCITSEKYSVKFRTGDLIPFSWSLIRNVWAACCRSLCKALVVLLVSRYQSCYWVEALLHRSSHLFTGISFIVLKLLETSNPMMARLDVLSWSSWKTCATRIECRYCLMLQVVRRTPAKCKTREKLGGMTRWQWSVSLKWLILFLPLQWNVF